MIIRNEKTSDIEAISEVTIAAFQNHPVSNHTEQYIIHALRDAKALTVSLVAEVGGQVVGHIAFSPVKPELEWLWSSLCAAGENGEEVPIGQSLPYRVLRGRRNWLQDR